MCMGRSAKSYLAPPTYLNLSYNICRAQSISDYERAKKKGIIKITEIEKKRVLKLIKIWYHDHKKSDLFCLWVVFGWLHPKKF